MNKIFYKLAGAGVLVLLLSGCSGQKNAPEKTSSAQATSVTSATASGMLEEASTFSPIKITHFFGETVIEKAPEKVVTVDWNNADPVLALGIIPVGTSKANWGPVGELGLLPWTEAKYKELGENAPNVFSDLEGYDFEAIAATKPDLILAPYSGMDETSYKKLSEIAPALPFKEAAWKTTWKEQTLQVAEALGKKEDGEKLVSEAETFIRDTLSKYPKLSGKSAALFYFNPTDLSNFSVYRGVDPRGAYLQELGFRFPDSIEAKAEDKNAFYVQISSELAPETLNDLDIIITYGDEKTVEALKADPILSRIPAVQNGQIVVLENGGNLSAACNPSILSIYAELENYLNTIAAVVK